MDEKSMKPAIRFTGFTDVWEQHKVGDFYDFKNGLNKGKAYFGNGVPIVNFTDVFHRRGIHSEELRGKVSLSSIEIDNFRVRKGDIFFTRTSETIDEIGFPSVLLDESIDTVFSGFVLRGRAVSEDPLTLLFKQYVFFTHAFRSEMIKKSTMTTRALTSGTAIKQMVFIYPPDREEQNRIGSFIDTLDHLITLHQRKHGKLVNIKKAMLRKMFPQDDASVPEVRFAGFTDTWEQRKLGELYKERNERGNDSLQILSVSIHNGVSSGELDSDALGKQVRRSEDKSLYKHVYFGDLVFNMMRAWQGAIGVVKAEGMVSPAYITAIPNEQVYPLFMDCCLSRNVIIAQMNNLSYGVTDFRKRLYWDSFVNIVCRIPSVLEQAKIISYFDHLDRLIALHQRELEKLQNLKKACLEKMFV